MMRQRTHDDIVSAFGEKHAADLRARDATIRALEGDLCAANDDVRRLADAITRRGLQPKDEDSESIIDTAIALIGRVPKPRLPRQPKAAQPAKRARRK